MKGLLQPILGYLIMSSHGMYLSFDHNIIVIAELDDPDGPQTSSHASLASQSSCWMHLAEKWLMETLQWPLHSMC